MSLSKFHNYVHHHNDALRKFLDTTSIPAARVKEAIIYSVFPGGKRLRPILVYFCGELLALPIECLDVIAIAIELTHCYSLVHDDLPAMDDDDFRRGKPSCHKAFDEATAILVGDALQALAIEFMLEKLTLLLTPQQAIAVTLELLKASGPSGMVSGQSLDLSELSKPAVDEPLLRHIHSLKTGKLINACVKMVLAAANPDELTTRALTEYSTRLGLVFQMQDDYLDQYANQALLGKCRASDMANDKTTFASLYSESELSALITEYFELTKTALAPLSDRASQLLFLTNYMQERGSHPC